MKRILPTHGERSTVACGKGGRCDDATRAEQASPAEVARIVVRAGAERGECGGVLPGAPIVRFAFLLVEEAAGGPWRGEFVEVKLAAAASTLGAGEDRRVEVVLRNGRSLRVGPGFDLELVRALAAVVESAA